MKRHLKTTFLIICTVIMMASAGCSAKANENPHKNDVVLHDALQTETALINLNETEEDEPLLMAGAPMNYLLYGYNVLDNGYIDSKSIDKSNPIIDAAKLKPGDFASSPNTSSDISYLFSNTASDLYKSLEVSAKSNYKGVLFSGSIKVDYKISQRISEQQTLIKYIQYHQTEEQFYTVGISKMKQMLSDDFIQDVKDHAITDPKYIFNTYGTHLIKQYYLGGRAELNFLYNNMSQQTKESLEANVRAAYSSFSGKVDAATEKKAKVVTEHSKMFFKSKGGDNLTGSSPAEIAGKYDNWVKSIQDKPVICGIADFEKSMLPIWELIDDTAAAQSLKSKFNDLAKDAKADLSKLDPKAMYISEIGVYSEPKSQDALKEIPNSFVKVLLNPGTDSTEILDANKGAGGDYIYIAYKLTTDRSKAITDIRIAVGDNEKASIDGYTKINVDLNRGAGGKYIYLCYKTASSDNELRLKEIRGVYTSTENAYTLLSGWEWVKDKVDLNKGAGGKYINLAIRKESAAPSSKK